MSNDLFSGHATIYAAFRPTYPEELFRFILNHVKNCDAAWDCGTGNGQVAQRVAKDFKTVYATDLSENQISNAVKLPNVEYSVARAEQTNFNDNSIDLITVGQALHWFDVENFYREVERVGKPGSILAVWGYGHITINADLDPLLRDFYSNVVGKYWDAARRHVENGYSDIPFPFPTIDAPPFFITQQWTLQHLAGYLESWSATQGYIRDTGRSPVNEVAKALQKAWGEKEVLEVRFPVFMKIGTVN